MKKKMKTDFIVALKDPNHGSSIAGNIGGIPPLRSCRYRLRPVLFKQSNF